MAKSTSGSGSRPGRERTSQPREFAPGDIRAMDAWGEEGFEDVRDTLDGFEQAGLKSYQYLGYEKLNRMLRNDDLIAQDTDYQAWSDQRALDRVMRHARTHTDVIAFRGFGTTLNAQHMPIGQEFEDKAYVSTTLNARMTTGFSDNKTIARIRVRKGAHAIYMDTVVGKFGGVGEQELLLNRGARFRVTGRSTMKLRNFMDQDEEYTVVDLDLV